MKSVHNYSIERSNENAALLLSAITLIAPELLSFLGHTEADLHIKDLREGHRARAIHLLGEARAELAQRRRDERNAQAALDLDILIGAADLRIAEARIAEALLPYSNLGLTVFAGLRSLFDSQQPPERQRRAADRLRRYAGLEEGHRPITRLAALRFEERMENAELVPPFRGEVERDLATMGAMVGGIGQLLDQFGLDEAQPAYSALREQFDEYERFLRTTVLPRARTDPRLPAELYAHKLRECGMDMEVDELIGRARCSYAQIRSELRALAPLVAREEGLAGGDYREVIAGLKRRQLGDAEILPHYKQRINELERLIAEHDIASLPSRPMRFRLASAAESAAKPAPFLNPPRLIGNTGEQGEFILPLRLSGGPGGDAAAVDDFSFDAASWTLTAHEGRPGHDLQYTAMLEAGVSIARAFFAQNSVNVEGWALYSEVEMRPWLPLDGQLICLQHQLLRAARAFLDPLLQRGEIGPETARRILREEVVLSPAMVEQEIERYLFTSPGQATSYFCGLSRMLELRAEAELQLGARFRARRFHDAVIAQGLLPPALLRAAVAADWHPTSQEGSSSAARAQSAAASAH